MKTNTATGIFVKLLLPFAVCAAATPASAQSLYFNRIATFPVAGNLPANLESDTETSAGIVAASTDGLLLAYTDRHLGAIGFIDITDPAKPEPAGTIKLDGEPTAVSLYGDHIYASINTSENYLLPSGSLTVFEHDEHTAKIVCDLDGQPDSIAINRDGSLLAVAIENERDEDFNDGVIPQLPAGNLLLFKINDGLPDCRSGIRVDLTGLAKIAGSDPEPEFVDFNTDNELAVTLQENNHIVVVDGHSGEVVSHFSTSSVDLANVDLDEEGALTFDSELFGVKREPDSVQWLDNNTLITANEGDYEGGSRGFTVFSKHGEVKYDSGLDFEYAVAVSGHYPEKRSGNRGVEPEGLEIARFGNQSFAFVLAERGSLIGVYSLDTDGAPELHQLLPSGLKPEGIVAIPKRNLLVTSNDVDLIEDNGPRSYVMIYEYGAEQPDFPQLVSSMDGDRPIGWGALSGLAADPADADIMYSINDSFYALQPSIYTIDVSETPATIIKRTDVTRDGKPARKLDLEGITSDGNDGFWLASEGRSDRGIPHALLHVNGRGEITSEVSLPDELLTVQKRSGFEGLTSTGSGEDFALWIAVQREWKDDPKGFVKILSYRPADKLWTQTLYPLDSVDKGWVGLSAIEAAGNELFVVERDNQQGSKALVKRLYKVTKPDGVEIGSSKAPSVLSKTLVRDFLPDLLATNGVVTEKLEGFAITIEGKGYAVTDNDGVDDHSGETYFFSFGLDGVGARE